MEKLSDNKSKHDKEAGMPPMNVLLHSKGKIHGREGSGVAATTRQAVLPAEHVTRKSAPAFMRN